MAFTNTRHTVKRFDSEIDSLIEQVLEMGRAAGQQVEQAVTAFRAGDIELAQAVVAGDDMLNRRDLDIDRACIRLLARRQPVSTDMRLVMSLQRPSPIWSGLATRPRVSPKSAGDSGARRRVA